MPAAVVGRRGQSELRGPNRFKDFLERVSHAPDGQSAKTGLSLTAMGRLFGGISDESFA